MAEHIDARGLPAPGADTISPPDSSLPMHMDLVAWNRESYMRFGTYWGYIYNRMPPHIKDRFDWDEVREIVGRTLPRVWIEGTPYRSWPAGHAGWQSFILYKFLRLERWMGIHPASKMKLGCFGDWKEAAQYHQTKPVFPSHTEFWAMFIIGQRDPRDKNKIQHLRWSNTLIKRIKKCQLQHLLPPGEDLLDRIPPKEEDDTFWDGYSPEAFKQLLDLRARVPSTHVVTRSKIAKQSKPDSPLT